MSFWDTVRRWFKGNPTPVGAAPSTQVVVPVRSAPAIARPATPTHMINSVTLSSDLSHVILVDDGRAISYSLDTKGGVVLGLLRGQLAVVSGASPFPSDETPDSPTSTDSDTSLKAAGDRPLRLVLGKKKHFTLTFYAEGEKLSVVGITDIDSSFRAGAVQELKCEAYAFSLDKQTVLLRRVGNALEIIPSDF